MTTATIIRGVLLVFLLVPTLHAEQTVRLTNGEWPPYLSEKLPNFGLASHIVSQAFKQVGLEVKYGFFEWNRAYNQAKAGRWHGSVIWGRKGDRERYFYFSDPVIMEETVFFYLRTAPFQQGKPFDWRDYPDLHGRNIGLTQSYFYEAGFHEAAKNGVFNVQWASSDEINFRKLFNGRIDLFPLDRVVATAILRTRFSEAERAQITYHPKAVKKGPMHLLLSRKIKGNKRLIMRFNQGLALLKKKGLYQQILDEFEQGRYALETD